MTIEKILIVDDETIVRNFLAETLRRKNLDVTTVDSGQKAFAALKETTFDMVITDMKMPDLTGLDVLRKVKELSPSTIVVIITGFGSIENTVEAMRCGAFNYLIKPFSPDTIEALIDKASEHLALIEENKYLRQQISAGSSRSPFTVIGESPAMRKILADVAQVAASNASIFIHGESGTGKEVIAHAIHHGSLRANQPFIKVNCAAIPETLIESEFFGHEKGAFTGANARRLGRFELANTGTLLLDEVTEIPLGVQAKLLRVIQEHEFERVGGNKPLKVDVRLISTSNRNVKEAIAQKIIREDLYYRLNVVPIYLPPLRERKEDILPLAEYFLEKISRENHREKKVLTQSAKTKLQRYDWPGNIRELANIIERAVVMDTCLEVSADHLFIETGGGIEIGANVVLNTESTKKSKEAKKSKTPDKYFVTVGKTLQELEKQLIIETLEAHQNDKNKAAEILGISPRTLKTKITAYKLTDL
ncbi:MAG: sigma-54-dependent Fis family transcriptional regulator [Parachlamydiaceae bacterium]|nr:sigma-54-dependent Fis family transcriptional regulator [Parachlamydiaceae bacterium]